jgi:hypothetical protein
MWFILLSFSISEQIPVLSALHRMKPVEARFAVPLTDFILGQTSPFAYHRCVRCVCVPPEKYSICLKCRDHQ